MRQPCATVKEYLTVQKELNRNVQRRIAFYNLDVIGKKLFAFSKMEVMTGSQLIENL